MDKKRILVVEDEYSINDGLTFSLRKEGYDVRSAFNGKAALELVESFKPELVLLDLSYLIWMALIYVERYLRILM